MPIINAAILFSPLLHPLNPETLPVSPVVGGTRRGERMKQGRKVKRRSMQAMPVAACIRYRPASTAALLRFTRSQTPQPAPSPLSPPAPPDHSQPSVSCSHDLASPESDPWQSHSFQTRC